MSDLPDKVQSLIGEPRYACEADHTVSRTSIRAMCAAVENGNPVYWDPNTAVEVAGREVAPAAMLSTWARPERWSPGERASAKPLQLHYDLKELLACPTAIVSSFESVFHTPVAVGDRLSTCQVLKSVSGEKDTQLGRGRFWVIEMQYRNQRGELVGVDRFDCLGYRRESS